MLGRNGMSRVMLGIGRSIPSIRFRFPRENGGLRPAGLEPTTFGS